MCVIDSAMFPSPMTPAATARAPDGGDKGSIAIDFVREALAELRGRDGADLDALLREAGIAPELLDSPRARVSPASYGALWHLLAQAFDDEFFGMDSRPMKAGSFTLLCHAVVHCGTLKQAVHRALRFLRLVLDDVEGRLERDGEAARIVLVERREAPRAFAAGTLLVVIHGLACWLVGRRVPLVRVGFRSPQPPFTDELRVIFAPELHFDQAQTSISFDAACLALPIIQNERTLKRFLREAPANFLVKYRNDVGTVASVRRCLKTLSVPDWPDFEALARQMNCSASTLRRRLEAEGRSYRTIRDELRYDLALDYLSGSSLAIPDIAAALGFAEPSAFHRAFRKWSGASPGAYRRGNVCAPDTDA